MDWDFSYNYVLAVLLIFVIFFVCTLSASVGNSSTPTDKSQFVKSENLSVPLSSSVNKSIPSEGTSTFHLFTNKVTPGSPVFNSDTTVKVAFDSMTVHNTHEGALSGDGEYDIVAYVQGIKVGLTDLSKGEGGPAFCAGFGCGFGLMDVSKGETVTFKPEAQVTVDLSKTAPLSVFTAGVEVDGCGRKKFPESDDVILTPPGLTLAEVFKNPQLNWPDAVRLFQDFARFRTTCIAINGNDVLGSIVKFYNPPLYGVGQHTNEVSDNGDFTLRYTITITKPPGGVVQPPPPCINILGVSGTSSSSSQNGFPPTNAIDNNPATKWISLNSLNPFITLDLGSQKSVCAIAVSWADGNIHPYRFNVAVSSYGVTFTNVFSGKSKGTGTLPEKYGFLEAQGRFVKLTITESTPGSPNSIAQISEVAVFGTNIGNKVIDATKIPTQVN